MNGGHGLGLGGRLRSHRRVLPMLEHARATIGSSKDRSIWRRFWRRSTSVQRELEGAARVASPAGRAVLTQHSNKPAPGLDFFCQGFVANP